MKKVLISLVLTATLLTAYFIFYFTDNRQPACADIGHTLQLSDINDGYHSQPSLSMALFDLFSVLKKTDKATFIKQFPSQPTFIELQHLTKYSAEKQEKKYEESLKHYQYSWDGVMSAGKTHQIDWSDIEFMGLGGIGITEKNSSKQNLAFHTNGKNYLIRVVLKRVDKKSAWKIMRLGKLTLI